MKLLFWSAAALITYAYVGYAGWLWLRARLRPRPVRRKAYCPTLTAVMVVCNEQDILAGKIKNLSELEYPADKLNFVIVSDGSSDSTNTILTDIKDQRFKAILLPQRKGKAHGLNYATDAATGEIVLFTDARQMIERDAVQLLMENFGDQSVGCASGELMLGDPAIGESGQGMGLYWRMEKQIRELESASGSVVGPTGAIYAARRELLIQLPADTILDDVYLPLCIAEKGKRIVFDGRAHAWDTPNLGSKREFSRKVRTLSGNYQLLQFAPWLLSTRNPIRFEFVSHKLLRLAVPFALAATLISSLLIPEPLYRIAALLQLSFYALSLVGFAHVGRGPLRRLCDAALTFVVLNMAAVVAFKNFVTRRRIAWS
jgi:cellulose synthase/poly-beta-1,6-N-acetylglucosamine synthase-like glycosyltransferase